MLEKVDVYAKKTIYPAKCKQNIRRIGLYG